MRRPGVSRATTVVAEGYGPWLVGDRIVNSARVPRMRLLCTEPVVCRVQKSPSPARDGSNPRYHPRSPRRRREALGRAVTGAPGQMYRPGLPGHPSDGSGASSGPHHRRACTTPRLAGAAPRTVLLSVTADTCNVPVMLRSRPSAVKRESERHACPHRGDIGGPILNGHGDGGLRP